MPKCGADPASAVGKAMKMHCPKTCGFCGGGSVNLSGSRPIIPVCSCITRVNMTNGKSLTACCNRVAKRTDTRTCDDSIGNELLRSKKLSCIYLKQNKDAKGNSLCNLVTQGAVYKSRNLTTMCGCSCPTGNCACPAAELILPCSDGKTTGKLFAGVSFATAVSCRSPEVKSLCHHTTHGDGVRRMCPKTCGSCPKDCTDASTSGKVLNGIALRCSIAIARAVGPQRGLSVADGLHAKKMACQADEILRRMCPHACWICYREGWESKYKGTTSAPTKMTNSTPPPSTAPTQPWVHLRKKQCYEQRLPKIYGSFAAAKTACQDNSKCSAIYKQPLGANTFFLCNMHPPRGSNEGAELWVKPFGTHHKTTGQNKAGKWCSNWCCCAASWHGDACNDFDECSSSPCQLGGTCTDSSTTYLVNDYFRKYRCACPQGYGGHNCAETSSRDSGSQSCSLRLGATSAKASTSDLTAYRQFQVRAPAMAAKTIACGWPARCSIQALHGRCAHCSHSRRPSCRWRSSSRASR